MILEGFLLVTSTLVLIIYYVVKQNKRDRIDFLGKHVVITGGTQGIGYELTLEAFRQGAHVSVLARNQARLDVVRSDLESIKKSNPIMSSQIIQVESIDIARNCDETKKIFDKVLIFFPLSIFTLQDKNFFIL
jgi:3-dehydrosphinganine reductase